MSLNLTFFAMCDNDQGCSVSFMVDKKIKDIYQHTLVE